MRRSTRKRKMKGIVGIEAAIVMIAFIIVAAALAFVTLNMGMYTTQKSKEVIGRGLEEASSALEVDGSVLALVNGTGYVDVISLPVKLSPGRESVDFNVSNIKILLSTGGSYENILKGIYYLYQGSDGWWYLVYVSGENVSGTELGQIDGVRVTFYKLSTKEPPDLAAIAQALGRPSRDTKAYVVFIKSVDGVKADEVLEFTEKAIIVILLGSNDRLLKYDSITIEIRPVEGSPLTVERTIPPTLTPDSTIDLG